jgi:hypothetical protein
MKNIVISVFLFLLSNIIFSQKKSFGNFPNVKKEKLNEVKFMSDIDPTFPKEEYSKMIDYVSIEIEGTCNGKQYTTAIGKSDTLTPEQIHILKSARAGTYLNANYTFKYKDSKNDDIGGSNKIKSSSILVYVIN